MNHFLRNLITEWRRLELPVSGTVVVGVSGGADSVSLLLAVHELKVMGKLDLRIVAAHFNHRLRDGESDADEQFVRELTAARKIEFVTGHAQPMKGNLEQAARDARYAFLTEKAEAVGAFAILTGHTVNDQAETFLMNLLRGAGPDGLGGMRTIREVRSGGAEGKRSESAPPLLLYSSAPLLLIRPLLTWAKRLDTEGFCREMGVEYRYDTMNEDTAFRRVRIRKILLPLLEDFNPKIVETLANTAALMQGLPQNSSIRPIADSLKISEIQEMSDAEAYDAIRSWLGGKRDGLRRLQLKHIQAVQRLAKSERSGRIAEIPGGRVVKSGGRLSYEENKVEN